MIPSCPSCGAPETKRLGPIAPGTSFAGRALSDPTAGGHLYSCPSCSLWFRWPQMCPERLAELYQNVPEGHWAAPPDDREDWNLARRWLDDHLSGGRILDVGCFDGRFLAQMDESWERCGIEINARAAAVAERRGVKVIASDAESLDDLPQTFDAITAFDVFEHVRDPRKVLELLSGALKPGGAVIIATGNTQAPSWRLMQHRYWYCAIPEHLSFLGEEWARGAAEALDLEVRFVERYSHEFDRSRLRWLQQALLSMMLKFAPRLFGALRASGFGEIDVRGRDELKTYPPSWTAAKDHFLVVLTR